MKHALAMLAMLALLAGCVTVTSTEKAAPAPRPQADMDEAARINTDLGMNYARTGDLETALDKFKRALAQNQNYSPAHAGIAYIYSQQQDYPRAEEHFKRALQLSSDDPNTRNNFGVFLCGQQRYKEAEKMFMQTAASPNYREKEKAYTNAGVCARRIPDLDKAEAYFREALKQRPEFPEALQQMVSLLIERKDFLRARAFLQRYEKVGVRTPASLWMGVKIESSLGDATAAADYTRRLKSEFPESEESLSLSTQNNPA